MNIHKINNHTTLYFIIIVFILFTISFPIYSQVDTSNVNSQTDESINQLSQYSINPNKLKSTLFTFHFGFQDGNDYGTSIKNFYSNKGYNVTGFLNFIGVGGRFEFRIASNLYIYPGLSIYFHRISRKVIYSYLNNYTETKEEATLLFSPEFGSNYYLQFDRNLLYFNFQLSYPLFLSPDDYDVTLKSISPEFGIGYRRIITNKNSLGIEIGYSILPVTVETNYDILNGDKDFGGIFFKLVGTISL